ncbi:MAG: hypothetical protein D3915_12500 [Candidatus Electrothrix sp. AU1_5]|nr:hypothetical protein [Candidatus Electrothrix gigas]
MKKQFLLLAAGAILLTASIQSSFAASASGGSVNYQVVLNPGCTVNSFSGGGNFDLGNHSSVGGDQTVPGVINLDITCATMTYGICVSGGTHYTASTRRLNDGGTNYLDYDLLDASNDTPVGDKGCNDFASIGVDTAAWADPFGGPVPGINGTLGSQTFSMYAIVTIPSNSAPGNYSDDGVQLTIVW